MWRDGTSPTTRIGYVNRNQQKNHGHRGVKGPIIASSPTGWNASAAAMNTGPTARTSTCANAPIARAAAPASISDPNP
jgi:hypothetical protein